MAKRKKQTSYSIAVGGARTILSILAVLLILIALIWASRTAYRFGYSIFHEEAMAKAPGETLTVEIPEDAGVREIGTILSNAGLINDVSLFVVQERLSDYHTKEGTMMHAGKFRVSTAMTPTQLMEVLSGDPIEEEEDAGSAAS